jgi:hypothetical protein
MENKGNYVTSQMFYTIVRPLEDPVVALVLGYHNAGLRLSLFDEDQSWKEAFLDPKALTEARFEIMEAQYQQMFYDRYAFASAPRQRDAPPPEHHSPPARRPLNFEDGAAQPRAMSPEVEHLRRAASGSTAASARAVQQLVQHRSEDREEKRNKHHQTLSTMKAAMDTLLRQGPQVIAKTTTGMVTDRATDVANKDTEAQQQLQLTYLVAREAAVAAAQRGDHAATSARISSSDAIAKAVGDKPDPT